jgi:hypothetical protein
MIRYSCAFIIFASAILVACVSVPFVEDDSMDAAINTSGFSCDEPFELTQDCSSNSYAVREISIDGQKIRIAASAGGDIVLVNSATPWADCFSNLLVLNCPSLSRKANSAYVTTRKFLNRNGLSINRVVPHTTFGSTIGYYIFLDSNGYDLLKTLSTYDESDDQEGALPNR